MATATIGALRIALSINAGKFARSTQEAGSRLDMLAAKAKNLGRSMARIGGAMSASLTLPIVAFGSSVLRAGGDFEKSMNRVQAVSGATSNQFEKLKNQAKELGATTQFSASQAADAMGFLAMAGFDANKIVGAMPGTLQLAASAQLDLAQSADIVSNVLTGYRMDVQDLGRVNDVLVKTFTSTNTNLVQLGEAMKYAGPVASAAGVRFEEAAAAIGLMGNAGIQASMAGTSLRGAISRVLAPSKQMQKLMKQAGLQFTDSRGRLLPLVEIIRRLEPHAENAGLMMELFGLRAGPAMAALVSQGADSLEKLTGKLDNAGGIAKKIADVQMKGFAGAMKELRSAFEALQIAIAESGFLQWMTSAAKMVAGFLRELAKTNPVILKFATVIAGVIAVVGPAILILGGLVAAFGVLAPAAAAAAAGIVAALGLITAPIALTVAAFGVLAATIASNWRGITNLAASIGESFKGIYLSAKKWLLDALAPIIDRVESFIDRIKRGFASIRNALGLGTIGEAIQQDLAPVTEVVQEKIDKLSEIWNRGAAEGEKMSKQIGPKIAMPIKEVADIATNSAAQVSSAVAKVSEEQNKLIAQGVALAEVKSPQEILAEKAKALDAALAQNKISAEQFGVAMSKATAVSANAYAGMASGIANNLATAFGESKAFAIAAAVINTAEAITKTFATYGATPWGFAAAAAAAAAGAAQIAAIKNTNKGSSGSKSSGSTAANAGAAASAGPRQSVSINLHGDSFGRDQVRALIDQINAAVSDGAELQVSPA